MATRMEPGVLLRMEAAKTLFRRCVQCPDAQPSCPQCSDGQVCQFNSQSCDSCASTSCVSAGSVSSGGSSSGSGSSTGAVAGGVVGGLVLIALIVFLVWRFCIRDRRRAYRSSQVQDYNMGSEKDFGLAASRSARQSRHSVASFASSAFTRASNIIPIAYIPGVTNRSVHSSQDLVPPVPPIPAASPTGSPQLEGEDSHYFLPKDLHDTYGDRQSMARNSIASTIYRNNAIVSPVPAQMGTRAKPMAVSVRSNGKTGSPTLSRSNTPPHSANRSHDPQQSSIVGRRAQAKPVQIIKSSSLRQAHSPSDNDVFELDGSGRNSRIELDGSGSDTTGHPTHLPPTDAMSPNLDGADSDDEHDAASQRLVAPSKTAKVNHMSSSDYDVNSPGIFASRDFSAEKKTEQKKSTASLNQIIEEAAMNASREPSHRGLGSGHGEDANPFSDGHAAVTP